MRPATSGTDHKKQKEKTVVAATPGPRPFAVGLMGLGTVGSGVCSLLSEQEARLAARHGMTFHIVRVLVRDPARPRKHLPPAVPVTGDADRFLQGRYDAVLECMGGVDPAGTYVAAFLSRGIPVITANKALLAERGEELHALAARHGTVLRYEASVAAGIPVLGVVERALQSSRVFEVQAVLNGTSNFLCTRMEEGVPFEEALVKARRLGFAEADPSLDLSGMDAAQKLTVLLRALGAHLPPAAQEVTGIEHVTPRDFVRARAMGGTLKPVAAAFLEGPAPRGYVAPALVRPGHPLAGVKGAECGVLLRGEPAGDLFLSGPGAGALPTAGAMVDDLVVAAKTAAGEAGLRPSAARVNKPVQGTAAALSCGWFLSVVPAQDATRLEDLLEFLAASGVVFREMRAHGTKGSLSLDGITLPLTAGRIARLAQRLRVTGAVETFRAFRVLEAPNPGRVQP